MLISIHTKSIYGNSIKYFALLILVLFMPLFLIVNSLEQVKNNIFCSQGRKVLLASRHIDTVIRKQGPRYSDYAP